MVFIPQLWILAISLYLGSFIGDLFDGMAARAFNQTSTFGGLLDMVTDRCTTLGLLFILYGEYGDTENGYRYGSVFRMLFLSLALLDIASHWCQMYSTAALQIHHKSNEGNANRFFLVRWYYQYLPFFGYCCVGAELTYIALYIQAQTASGSGVGWLYRMVSTVAWYFIVFVSGPGCAIKQIVNVFQLCSACTAVAAYDAEQRNEAKRIGATTGKKSS